MQETQETSAPSLGGEEPLEEGMATYSSILPEESHEQRSLVGYSAWVTKSGTWPKWLSTYAGVLSKGEACYTFCSEPQKNDANSLQMLGRRFFTHSGNWGSSGITPGRRLCYQVQGALLTPQRWYNCGRGGILSPGEKLPWQQGRSSDHRLEKILESKLRQRAGNIFSTTNSLLFLPISWLPQMDSF